jgi:hypothetical protein
VHYVTWVCGFGGNMAKMIKQQEARSLTEKGTAVPTGCYCDYSTPT